MDTPPDRRELNPVDLPSYEEELMLQHVFFPAEEGVFKDSLDFEIRSEEESDRSDNETFEMADLDTSPETVELTPVAPP